MATYFFEFDNRQMGYQKTGTGPAVILLHGFGEDHSIFNSTVTALEKNYTVYTPDLPGTGMSSINSNEYPANFSIEYLADSVAALTHHEKINNCTLLGHSMGGYTTMAFANKYPGYLNAFGLLHSTALPDTPLKIENRTRGISFIEKMGAASFYGPPKFNRCFSIHQCTGAVCTRRSGHCSGARRHITTNKNAQYRLSLCTRKLWTYGYARAPYSF